jgi:hypothetical protein
MESTLTPPEPSEDPLEMLLRAAPPAIPDNGFTARVCAALPPRETSVPPVARRLVLCGALLVGCLLAGLACSRFDPALPVAIVNAAREWKFELWQALLFVIALSAWAVARDEQPDAAIVTS